MSVTKAPASGARDGLIRKIRALRARTTEAGCTEQEALAAAEMASRLLAKYAIAEGEVEFAADEWVMEEIGGGSRLHPVFLCTGALGQLTSTVITAGWQRVTRAMIDAGWDFSQRRPRVFNIFGAPQDVEVAIYLLETIKGAMERGWREYRAELCRDGLDWRPHRASYLKGMARRIGDRLMEQARARSAEVSAVTGRDLMAIKRGLVDEEHTRRFGRPRLGGMERPGSATAYGRGWQDGAAVGLHRGITPDKRPGDRLGLPRPPGS